MPPKRKIDNDLDEDASVSLTTPKKKSKITKPKLSGSTSKKPKAKTTSVKTTAKKSAVPKRKVAKKDEASDEIDGAQQTKEEVKHDKFPW